MTGPRKARYRITAVHGEVPEGIEVGAVLVDRYRGRSYSWKLMDLRSGHWTATWDGEFIGWREESQG